MQLSIVLAKGVGASQALSTSLISVVSCSRTTNPNLEVGSKIRSTITVFTPFVDNDRFTNLDSLLQRLLSSAAPPTSSVDAADLDSSSGGGGGGGFDNSITVYVADASDSIKASSTTSTTAASSSPSSSSDEKTNRTLSQLVAFLRNAVPDTSSVRSTPLLNLKSNLVHLQTFSDDSMKRMLGEMSGSHISYRAGLSGSSSANTYANSSAVQKDVERLSRQSLSLLLRESSIAEDDDSSGTFELKRSGLATALRLDRTACESINLLPKGAGQGGNQYGSIYGVLDRCKTRMGKRLLEEWLRQPLVDVPAIQARQDKVQFFLDNSVVRDKVRNTSLKGVSDLQALVAKLGRNKGGLKELYDMYVFANDLPLLIERLNECEASTSTGTSAAVAASSPSAGASTPAAAPHSKYVSELTTISNQLRQLKGLAVAVLDMSLAPREFMVLSTFDETLVDVKNRIDDVADAVKEEFAAMNEEWSSFSGKPLNSVRLEDQDYKTSGGLYFRLPSTNDEKTLREKMPHVLIHQILKNGVYFSTKELRRLGETQQSLKDEYRSAMRGVVDNAMAVARTYAPVFEHAVTVIAELDVLMSFAHVAATSPKGYVRPTMTDSNEDGAGIFLEDARHPCVELQDDVEFIPNDYKMEFGKSQFHIITGPNMGGKSTYIRGLGAIVAMAQVGSFVPCSAATINVVDAILCRVGAGDAQQLGISTFMAEMLEASAILQTATKRSLIIVDELGRGTSTFDGFGLAWAISKYIVDTVGCCTQFATHFHELTALEEEGRGVVNFHVSAQETSDTGDGRNADGLVFLYKVNPGPCLQSFGIQVAEMAKIPGGVIAEAKRKAKELENFDFRKKKAKAAERMIEANKFLLGFKEVDMMNMEGDDEKKINAVRALIVTTSPS